MVCTFSRAPLMEVKWRQERLGQTSGMTPERIKVWQCVGCGRIDHPQPCIGVCRDEKAEYVLAGDCDAAIAQEREASRRLLEVVRTVATVTPRAGEWERSWRALQAEARHALGIVLPPR